MNKIKITTSCKKLLADVFTPVGIYLRLRDRFRDTILLESNNYISAENSYSFIGINAIAGIEIKNHKELEIKYPNTEPQKKLIDENTKMGDELNYFMQAFQVFQPVSAPKNMAQGLFGYTSSDAADFFNGIQIKGIKKFGSSSRKVKLPLQVKHASLNFFSEQATPIPFIRYRLYQYIIVFNHFKSELFICENKLEGIEGDTDLIESIIRSKDIPEYPFSIVGIQSAHSNTENFKSSLTMEMNSDELDKKSYQISTKTYAQSFVGDEFNVYRALRNISSGHYLFYFDYGDNRLFGSGKGIHTKREAERKVPEHSNPFHLLAMSLPGNKLIDSPTKRTINEPENDKHVYFGGSIGFIGFDGSINHAVMVRAFLSKNGQLIYNDNAGVVNSPNTDKDKQIATNELNILTQAIELAAEFN
jgi:anthranilate synthase component 1